jgi:two-component system KDP operon response regulator KdpE
MLKPCLNLAGTGRRSSKLLSHRRFQSDVIKSAEPMTLKASETPGLKVLLIDDDPQLIQLVADTFLQAGYEVCTAPDGQEGIYQAQRHQPDLVILDLVMPNMDGRETYLHIRQVSDVPIIVLTGLGQEEELIIRCLREGVDDYLVKPISMGVLLSRAEALLRRAALPSSSHKSSFYDDGYLMINLKTRQVSVEGQPLKLTKTEYDLLAYLFKRAGQTIAHSELLKAIWSWENEDQADNIHLYIAHLRKKLKENPRQPRYLLTEYKLGYRFQKQMPK